MSSEEYRELDQHEAFLTECELALRHKRSVKTLRNARVYGGYIPFVRIGRSIRYRLSDVLAFERANLRTSTSDCPERILALPAQMPGLRDAESAARRLAQGRGSRR